MENWTVSWRTEVGLRSLVCCLCAVGANNKFELTLRRGLVLTQMKNGETDKKRKTRRKLKKGEEAGDEECGLISRSIREAFFSRTFPSELQGEIQRKALKNTAVDGQHTSGNNRVMCAKLWQPVDTSFLERRPCKWKLILSFFFLHRIAWCQMRYFPSRLNPRRYH